LQDSLLLGSLGEGVDLLDGVVAVEESSGGCRGGSPEGLRELACVLGLGRLGLLGNTTDSLGCESLLLVLRNSLHGPLRTLDLGYVRVELEHGTQVGQRVALLRGLGEAGPCDANLGLHLIGVDDARKVSIEHAGAGKNEVLLDIRLGRVRAEHGVKLLEGSLDECGNILEKTAARNKILHDFKGAICVMLKYHDVAQYRCGATVNTQVTNNQCECFFRGATARAHFHFRAAVDCAEVNRDRFSRFCAHLRPDDESAEVTAGSELEEAEPVDGHDLHAGDVAERLLDTVVVAVDDEGSLALDIAPVPHLTLTSADLLGVLDVVDILEGLVGLEESKCLLGLGDGLDLIADNEGNLQNLADPVATSHEESRHRRGSESRADSHTPLVVVGLGSPLPPGLVGVEHASTTAPAHRIRFG
jgi:hypothetical protein